VSGLERSLLGLFGAAWGLALLYLSGALPLAGAVGLSLYGYYGIAAAGGWLAGNVWVQRRRGRPRPLARRLLVLYLFGPPAFLFLLRAAAPPALQAAAPLAPLWAFGVYGVFFLVPVTLPPYRARPG
jgi:hypothetical protein